VSYSLVFAHVLLHQLCITFSSFSENYVFSNCALHGNYFGDANLERLQHTDRSRFAIFGTSPWHIIKVMGYLN